MDKKKLYGLIFTFVFIPLVQADTLELAQGYPDRYVVKKGDTLWDISGRFLKEPWRWKELWEKNPQIDNPHLIYPGDIISLVYQDGEPIVRVRRGRRPTLKLSPQVRSSVHETAIPTIPIDVITPFLNESRVVSEGVLEAAPYVVSVGKEHLVGGARSRVYVKGLPANGHKRFAVYRQGAAYSEPGSENGEVLGYEALYVGDAVFERGGDPATLSITRSSREVLGGDRLLPMEEDQIRKPFLPHAPDIAVNGTILSVVDGVTQIGQYQVVVLNLGRENGMEIGHVLAVHQKGEEVVNRVKLPEKKKTIDTSDVGLAHGIDRDLDLLGEKISKTFTIDRPEMITLPDERAGVVLVFRIFDKVSYALVMEATRAMHIHDRVTNP